MTIFIFANNVNSSLAGAVSNSATSITLSSSANLPASIPAGSYLVITLNDAATRQNFEILYATAISGATLTVLRGQEGTAALAWLTGDYAYSPPTKGQQNNFGQFGTANTWTGNNTFSNPITIAGAGAVNPNEAVNQGQFPSTLSANGWKEYPDPNSPTGYFTEQFGTVTFPNSGTTASTATVTFPFSFPNACLNITGTCLGYANSIHGFMPTFGCASSPSQSGATVVADLLGGGAASVTFNQAVNANYRAIGY